ncbi:hypothetical protein KKH15_01770 [Patescibacteria group bacterium]|nr:hypothetical protein [Patescibacteria group bacterium]MBU1754776.1 hypothetical protein [Patescibacteria group bacterium]
MGINYSQKHLLSAARHSKKHSKHAERLRMYAFLTGILSMLISFVHLVLTWRF